MKERADRTPIDLQGFRYDEATKARVDSFVQDMSQRWGRRDAPEQARARYGDTYMYYYFFVDTPSGAQRIREARGGFGGTGHE